MKPIRAERLGEAVRRVVAKRSESTPTPAPPEDETIPVELGGVTRFIQRSQILYASAHGDYARMHTATGSHLVRVSLNALEERWGDKGFVRIHRSTLVSLAHVTEVSNDAGRAVVRVGDVELQVSRRHTRDLRDRLLRPAAR
jgi:DNA-binding LytR/AlgR family response regulator